MRVSYGRPMRALLPLLVCAALLGSLSGPASAATITTAGPIESIALGDELSCQVEYVNDVDLEFFPPATAPGDCGTFLAVNGTLYAPDFEAHGVSATWDLGSFVPFTPISQTPVQGTGSRTDPYRVTTVVDAGINARLSETISYVTGSNTYRIDIAVQNLTGGTLNVVLYHAGDCYASGSDIGFGFTRKEVSSAGCSQTAQNSPPARTIQFSPLSAGSQFFEARYDEVWAQIATKAPLPSTCRCGEHIDNGVALSWVLSLPPGLNTVRSLAVSFTESTPPAPGPDTDGDALPDAWELGNGPSGDYENLAPLGADPNRKDVFVHVDYMNGCKPPKGWELNAIRVFREHGIALHLDSGPDSINADGLAWGARSAVKEPLDPLPDFALWDAFDRLKDKNFIASNRRRSFHYAALVRRFNGRDGGAARSIPEADFVVAACEVPKALKVKLKDYLSAVFVHELGHNLGLRHGGGDDIIGKPNYYGIMNYFWAFRGGLGKDGVPGSLPEFSGSVRPEINERKLDEQTPQVLPVAWICPNYHHLDIRYEFGQGTARIDWNCNGIYGEGPYELNLNSVWEPGKTTMAGFNDWRPGAMRFDGGGVLGDFDLPERPSPVVTNELTVAEFLTAQKARERSRREAQRQLVVEPNKYRLRNRKAATVRIAVTTQLGKRVRGARIKVRGARLIGAPTSKQRPDRRGRPHSSRAGSLRTDRRGQAQLHLLPGKRGDVRIFVVKRGFTRGGVVLAVEAKHKKTPKSKR